MLRLNEAVRKTSRLFEGISRHERDALSAKALARHPECYLFKLSFLSHCRGPRYGIQLAWRRKLLEMGFSSTKAVATHYRPSTMWYPAAIHAKEKS